MRSLPLYLGGDLAPVEAEDPLSLDSECTRCTLSKRKGVNVCLPAEGEPGGLLVIGEGPGKQENATRRPFVGASGRLLRSAIDEYWPGPVAYDLAVRCMPGRDGPGEKAIKQCRGYLAQTVREVMPTRIIAVGGVAGKALFGRNIQTLSTRRGWSYLPGTKVPVFFVIHPTAALRNRFVSKWFASDIEWALTAPDPQRPPWDERVRLVQTGQESAEAVAELYEYAADGCWFAFDVETCGAMYSDFHKMTSLAICPEGSDEAYVWTAPALLSEAALKPLRRFFADPSTKLVGQNVKFDAQVVKQRVGIEVAGIHGDVRLWRKQLFTDADAHLNVMAELVGMGGMKEEAVKYKTAISKAVQYKKWEKIQGGAVGPIPRVIAALESGEPLMRYVYGLIPTDALYRYNARDAVSTSRLGVLLEPKIKSNKKLSRTWNKLLKPAAPAVEQIERWGILVDDTKIRAFAKHLDGKLAPSIIEFAKRKDFNPNSAPQVSKILFGELGLKVKKLTETGAPSTDEEALKHHEGKHPFVDAIIAHRKYTKLKGTYADGMLDHVRLDGRIHPSFNIDGARSGRMSCSEPNLQNIPRPTSVEGKMARDCFTVPDGFVMLSADYSQLELRIAAALSGDPVMRQIFLDGVDYHQRTAEMISQTAWGIPPEAVTKKHRDEAKVVNFMMMYGAGDGAIAYAIGTTKTKAARVKEAVLGRFKHLARYMRRQLALAKKTGEVWTWWDGGDARCRPLWRVADADDLVRSRAEHGTWNTPIQGTASDFCLASLNAVVDWIREEMLDNDVKLVCTVHDSLILEVRKEMVSEVATKVRDIMVQWDSKGVPLVVDLEVGTHWGSLEGYKLQPQAA